MEKAVISNSQFRNLVGNLSMMPESIINQLDGTLTQNAIDDIGCGKTQTEFVKWVNNGCQLIQQIGAHVMQFVTFTCEIIILEVKEFVVSDFYKSGESNGIKLFFGSNFETWILNPMKKMKISLPESKLKKHLLIKNAYDTEMQKDFQTKPIISVKEFVAQLKNMILAQPNGEFKKDGLDVSGKTNIFHVDLSELGDNRVVAMSVFRRGDAWYVNAYGFDYINRWYDGRSFFAPATKAVA